MNEVRRGEFDNERGKDVGDQNYALRNPRADEVEGSRENDDIEDVVD